jgi:hypothetical protein
VGVITESMTRLRDEIVSWRRARVALQGDLVRQTDERRAQVSALCAGFGRDRAGAHRAWFGPTRAERQTAERHPQRQLAQDARAKAWEKQRMLSREAAAKAHGEEPSPVPPKAEPPPASPKAEPQRREAAKAVTAPYARPPVAPSPQAQKPPFKGAKKH